MTKYSRVTGKVFGASATASGDDPEIGQFGSALAGTYNGTSDIATIQSLPAWSNGFIGCVTPNTQFPPLPEMTGFGKVLSQQICYLLQQGIAEYDSGTTYYTGNWCSYNSNLYIAKADGFTNQLPTNTTYWSKFTGASSRNLGEIVTSSLPLTDGTLHLADGSLLSATNFPDFLSYISSIYVPPTVINYYCWSTLSSASILFYTTNSSPVYGDTVYTYNLLADSFTNWGTVNSVVAGTITVKSSETMYACERDSEHDEAHTVFSQNYFTTEANWQAIYTTYGECGKYVYNSSTNTVRIPLYNSYFTNTVNPLKLGDLTEASLPNIKGTFGGAESYNETQWNTGAFYSSDQNTTIGGSSNRDADLTHFDASLSNSIYKDSATTVNTQSIKQLVYIVVAK